jgi:hypothetical protein
MAIPTRLRPAVEVAEDLAMALRLGRDLPAFLQRPLTVDALRRRVQRHLRDREHRFLTLIDRAVYAFPRSPYRRLLVHAGCERGDVHALVAREGVEGALQILAGRGVYVSFDELKGRRPAVRGSARFRFADRDFDNPLRRPQYLELTGGTRGRPTRVRRSLASVVDSASALGLALEAHGVHNPRNLFWFGASLTWPFVHLKLGQPIDAWFYPVRPLPPMARVGLRYAVALARLAGHRLPAPRYCDVAEPDMVARWLLIRPHPEQPLLVNAPVSSAARVASEALALGRLLPNVTFRCRSEPLTAPRRRLVEQVGAGALPDYGSVELPSMAYGCATGTAPDDHHFYTDRYAAIRRPRAVFEHGPTVDSLLVTTLSAHAGKIGLNTELGDTARVEVRDCGCLLGELGLRTHLSEIRSFEKLSTEGTTFARSNVVQILEETLPARFGGTPIDYQLVEEERADGSARLVLRVHPEIGEIDEAAVCAALLDAMGAGDIVDAYQARLIERTRAVVVERRAPVTTRAGKVLPFQLSRLDEGSA